MKILAITSTIDLKFEYGCTLQWWQLFKGLYEEDIELLVVPYLGYPIEAPWWRVYKNPCTFEGELYLSAKKLLDKMSPPRQGVLKETFKDKTIKQLTRAFIQPKWRRHLDLIFSNEKDIDVVVVFGLPLNQFVSLPGYIKSKYNKPVVYYDGDIPASLPKFGGFVSGFRRYDGADVTEYDIFLSNSKGGMKELSQMGAHNVNFLYWGADPEIFSPIELKQDIDVFFYGFGYEYRKEWIEAMLTNSSRILDNRRFVIRGSGFNSGIDLGNTALFSDVHLSRLRNYACRSKINLNITRHAHASVYASSSARLFELASMGCCIVSNPCSGIEEWLKPGEEIFVVHDEKEALDTYKYLLAHDEERKKVGMAARQRVLREHTYRHRARSLVNIIMNNSKP